jgi:uncharacterized protein (TIGR03437 family)
VKSIGASAAYSIQKTAVAPGLLSPPSFYCNQNNTQYLVAQFTDGTYAGDPCGSSGVAARPAKQGDVLIIYGVGFGDAVNASSGVPIPPGTLPTGLSSLTNSLTFAFGPGNGIATSTSARVLYAGLAPDSVGLYQFNIVVPNVPLPAPGAPGGDYPVNVTVNGVPLTQNLRLTINQ